MPATPASMVSKAVLTAGKPEGDVLWGIDDPNVTRALDAEVFARTPDRRSRRARLQPSTAYVPELTPVDTGDVCLNVDIGWFADEGLEPPTGFDDLLDAGLPGPARRREPGHEFARPGLPARHHRRQGGRGLPRLLERPARQRRERRRRLGHRLLRLVHRGRGRRRPADRRQLRVESAGHRSSTPRTRSRPSRTTATVDLDLLPAGRVRRRARRAPSTRTKPASWSTSWCPRRSRSELPLTNFVYPVRDGVVLPEEFVQFAPRPDDPLRLDPADIAANRTTWIDEWTATVLR